MPVVEEDGVSGVPPAWPGSGEGVVVCLWGVPFGGLVLGGMPVWSGSGEGMAVVFAVVWPEGVLFGGFVTGVKVWTGACVNDTY